MNTSIDATAFRYRVTVTDRAGNTTGAIYYTNDRREADAVAGNYTAANCPDRSAHVEPNPGYKGVAA